MNTNNDSKKGISSSWIYLGIIIILIAGGIYLMLTKNMSDEENIELANQVEQVNTDKNTLEQEYNAALAKFDDLKTKGQQMETILAQKNAEVENLKNQIKNILGKKNASDMELMQANKLIATLNDKLNNYASQNQQIQAINDKLTAENQQYAAECQHRRGPQFHASLRSGHRFPHARIIDTRSARYRNRLQGRRRRLLPAQRFRSCRYRQSSQLVSCCHRFDLNSQCLSERLYY